MQQYERMRSPRSRAAKSKRAPDHAEASARSNSRQRSDTSTQQHTARSDTSTQQHTARSSNCTAEVPLAGAASLAEQQRQHQADLTSAAAERDLLAAKVEHLEQMQARDAQLLTAEKAHHEEMQAKDAKLFQAEKAHHEEMLQATAQSNAMLRDLILATSKSVENASVFAESTRQLAAAASLNAHVQAAPQRLNSMAQATLTARKL